MGFKGLIDYLNLYTWQLQRIGGSIGLTQVTWQVLTDTNNDLVDHQGNVTFINQQLTSDLELKVRGDTVPELDELFVVELVVVSRVCYLSVCLLETL